MTAVWIAASDIARGAPLASHAVVGVLCRLDDPAIAALPTLPPTPADRADAARPLAGRREHFLARRALARRLVALRAGVDARDVTIAHDPGGAPRVIAPGGFHVSVSARGDVAAIVVAEGPVGVDIEPVENPREPVWHVLHPRERPAIEADWRAGGDALFTRTWVAKEAWLKATGTGFRRDPAEIEIVFSANGTFVVHDPVRGEASASGVHDLATLGPTRLHRAVVARAAAPGARDARDGTGYTASR